MSQAAEKDNPYELAHSALSTYVKLQFPDYLFANYHIEIAKKLMLIEQGVIDRLIIATPPRHGKTCLVSEYFAAWYLGRNPAHQIIAATYSHDRATDTGRKVRNQMLGDTFKAIFPGCNLSSDSKSAHRLGTDQDGNYFSVGVGGAITGRGGNLILIDDPIKGREEAESDINRRKLIEWYKSVAYTRLMPGGKIVVVATRWHYDDLTGYLLDDDYDKWTMLKFPAIAEEPCKLTNRNKGDALWPEKYPVDKLINIKHVVGSREWSSLYQQEPLNEEGAITKLSWFQRYDESEFTKYDVQRKLAGDKDASVPFGITNIVISWDTAFKESEINTPSCATVWGISPTGYYLMYIFNKQINFPKLKRNVVLFYERYMNFEMGPVVLLIEDKASGQSLIQVLEEETSIPIIKIKPIVSKILRMESVTHIIESGRVYIPKNGAWLSDFERQMSQFPLGKFNDIVDSTSQFLRWVAKPKPRRRGLKFWK